MFERHNFRGADHVISHVLESACRNELVLIVSCWSARSDQCLAFLFALAVCVLLRCSIQVKGNELEVKRRVVNLSGIVFGLRS